MNHSTGRHRRRSDGQPPRTAYTPREVADRLGVHYETALALLHSGAIRSRRAGRRFIVPIAAVEEYERGCDIPAPA